MLYPPRSNTDIINILNTRTGHLPISLLNHKDKVHTYEKLTNKRPNLQFLFQFGAPYMGASVPLTYSPYLPGLVSPLVAGGVQDQVGMLSPASVQPQSQQQQQSTVTQQQQQLQGKQRTDRLEVRLRTDNRGRQI